MKYSENHPIYIATGKLVSALEKLEASAQRIEFYEENNDKALPQEQEEELRYYIKENAALRQEQERLNESLLSLRKQYKDLQNVASTISGRLDDSIEHLTEILENNA